MADRQRPLVLVASLVAVAILGVSAVAASGALSASDDSADTQTARLYELQSAFHAAATLRNPNDLDERLADMLALWAEDGTLSLGPNTFTGKGEPGTTSCDPGSMTLCDFFSNVAPPFQNPWISLAPAFSTAIAVSGNKATIDFQCLYFTEEWVATARLGVAAEARRSGGAWLFASAVVTPIPPPGIPYP